MRAAFVQFAPKYLAVGPNLDAVERLVEGVDADLIVLPELFTTGYFFRSTEDAHGGAERFPDGPACRRLAQWARATRSIYVAGLAERDGDRFYNSAVVVGPSGVVGTYRKLHLYYEEKLHFEPGDAGLQVFDVQTREGEPYRLGVMICFDWFFPEAARTLALRGADVIAHPSNLVRKDCPTAMPVRAVENHVYTITANRYGKESNGREELTFIGQSTTCDPHGEVLARAPREGDHVAVVDMDLSVARDRHITEHNHVFADRRPEEYDPTLRGM